MTQIYRTTKIPEFYFKQIEDYLNTSSEFVSVSEFIRDSIKDKLKSIKSAKLPHFLLTKDLVFNEETINIVHKKILLKNNEKEILKEAMFQPIINKSLDMDYMKFISKFLVYFAKIHPFEDGNKRTSWILVDLFLRLNNKKLQLKAKKESETPDEMFIWQNSTNQKTTSDVTEFLKKHIVDYKENSEDLDLEIEKSIKENKLLLTKLSR